MEQLNSIDLRIMMNALDLWCGALIRTRKEGDCMIEYHRVCDLWSEAQGELRKRFGEEFASNLPTVNQLIQAGVNA
jgi:hypothetical protein